ncbi:hypothetical protein LSH36_590g01019 [Paralvinella palmiformis]|uniref:G-protein coupled receptors family 1 profile domain-containing protein n=1 Tax=Paralvinella palmiformis TaxID=53620 RepID=A0AAD9MWS3_9ANNE|nr:hypothetical protein LSH36_590g01019 [Paralvinella palmiformis]
MSAKNITCRSKLGNVLFGNGSEVMLNTSFHDAVSHPVYTQWFELVIPIISFLGILGNILNLIVLTRQRILSSMDRLERSATYGLAALALSDMMFCVAVFPHAFTYQDRHYSIDGDRLFDLYYRMYGIATINLFLMTSTWLIVVLAVSRYMVVVYPLRARYTVTVAKTTSTIVLTYAGSLIMSLPHFLHLRITACSGIEGHSVQEIRGISDRAMRRHLTFYIKWIWPVFADFVPLLILVFCNTRLACELRQARMFRRSSSCHLRNNQDRHDRVTLTLVIIILMLLVFVSPSEIIRYVNPYGSWGYVGYIVASVTNVLQALNFAINFALYCAVNRHFRQAMCDILCRCTHKGSRLNASQFENSPMNGKPLRQQSVVLAVKKGNSPTMSCGESFL